MGNGLANQHEERQAVPTQAFAFRTLLILAAISFVGHLLLAGSYGYFRDELYYIADGYHLQAGYVDQPALIGWLAALLRLIAGDGLVAIHVVPALVCAAIIVVTGHIAREMGGGRIAQLVAGVAALFAPVLMATGSLFSMDVFDQLWWSLGCLVIARILRRDEPRLWIAFGVVAALGFLTKLTILFFGLSVLVGLLASRERRYLRTPFPWIAVAIAFGGLLPYLVWNALSGWPTLEFYRTYRYLTTGPLSFLAGQIALMNPAAFPLAVAGVVFFFRRTGAQFRLFGWMFLALYVVLTALHGKPYFLGPAYPALFAGGGVAIESMRAGRWLRWARSSYLAVIAVVGLAIAPVAMPILPPTTYVRFYGSHTATANAAEAQSGTGTLPQTLADRLGWRRLTRTVQGVYAALPPSQRARACVIASNYGEASALSFLAAPGELPPVISGHNNYYLWGPDGCSGKVLITVGIGSKAIRAAGSAYRNVKLAATDSCTYCVAFERHLPIYVLSDPVDPTFELKKVWPLLKHYD